MLTIESFADRRRGVASGACDYGGFTLGLH